MNQQHQFLDQNTLKTIAEALDNTTNANNMVRKKAEDILKQAKKMPGYTSALL